ncbi:MAG: toll/interleukin-1 receptor domain-containing protein [Candidatus Limnocylindrales bacterium]
MTAEEPPKTTGRDAPPPTVFISHASEDSAMATEVCRILEGDGIRCWIAPRDVEPGRPFSEGILDGIESARVMVLLLSGHANQSAFVNKEVERAISKGKVVIPLRIQDVQPSRALELFISSTQWIDAWAPPLESRVHVLAAAIRGLLYLPPLQGNEPTPAVPAPAVPAPVTPVAQVNASPRERRLPVSRRAAGLSIAGLVAVVACVVLVAGLLLGSHAGSKTKPLSSPAPTAASSSRGVPVISSVDLRPDTSTGSLVVYQDVHFSDSDGDVYRWDFRIAGSTIPGAQSQGGELNIPSAFQKSGAVATAEWLCGNGGYSMPLQVTFTDRANHQSVPYEYTLDCTTTG